MQSLSAQRGPQDPQRGPQALRALAMGVLMLRRFRGGASRRDESMSRTMIHQRSRSRTVLTLVTVNSFFSYFASQALHNRTIPLNKISEHFSFFFYLWCIFLHFITIYIEGGDKPHLTKAFTPYPSTRSATHQSTTASENSTPQPARTQKHGARYTNQLQLFIKLNRRVFIKLNRRERRGRKRPKSFRPFFIMSVCVCVCVFVCLSVCLSVYLASPPALPALEPPDNRQPQRTTLCCDRQPEWCPIPPQAARAKPHKIPAARLPQRIARSTSPRDYQNTLPLCAAKVSSVLSARALSAHPPRGIAMNTRRRTPDPRPRTRKTIPAPHTSPPPPPRGGGP